MYIYNIHAPSLAQATYDILWYHRPLSCRPISTRVICELKKTVNEKGLLETGTKTFKQQLGSNGPFRVSRQQWIIGNRNIPRFWCQPRTSHIGYTSWPHPSSDLRYATSRKEKLICSRRLHTSKKSRFCLDDTLMSDVSIIGKGLQEIARPWGWPCFWVYIHTCKEIHYQ